MGDGKPQLYLVTPPQFELGSFAEILARVLDTVEIACVRLDLVTRDEDVLLRAADSMRPVTEPRDVALVLRDHWIVAQRAGLDGVHLTDGPRNVRAARKTLGPDAIVGAFCGTSRHAGMTTGEAGADYASFGPVAGVASGPDGLATADLFAWWSDVIELPVVAEGGLDEESVVNLSTVTDFLAIGEEIWRADNPVERLRALFALM